MKTKKEASHMTDEHAYSIRCDRVSIEVGKNESMQNAKKHDHTLEHDIT